MVQTNGVHPTTNSTVNGVLPNGTEEQKKKPKPSGTGMEPRIRIHDNVYDVSEFVRKHPGGKILEFYFGQDATEAYGAFHSGSKKAAELLMALPKVRVADATPEATPTSLTEPVPAITKEFRELRVKWKKEGLMNGRIGMELLLFSVILAMMSASFFLLHLGFVVCSGLMMGLAWAQCGFLQHNFGHLEVFQKHPSWDRTGNLIVEGLFKGGSGSWWRNRHSKHHAKTNIYPHDSDLRTTPLFAWDEQLAMKCPKWLAGWQHILFVPILAMYVPVFFVTTKRFMFVKRKYFEMFLSAMHYVVFISLLFYTMPDLSWAGVAGWFYVGYAIQGMWLGFFFSLSHFALPVVHDEKDDTDWVTMHCKGTLDWGEEWHGWDWLAGHLNYQIEHHLVPEMPTYNYRMIQGDVRALCEKHGVEYNEMTFWDSVCLNFGTLKTVGAKRAKGEIGTNKEPLIKTTA